MKLRMPFLLWMLLQSTTGIYAINCTPIADSLYQIGKTYEAELRASTDPVLQQELEVKAIDAYTQAINQALGANCSAQFNSLKDADFVYKLALKASKLDKREDAAS